MDMTRSLRSRTSLVAAAALVASAVSCGDVVRTGRSPVMLIIDQLQAAPGGGFGANQFGNTLHSDVIVLVTQPPPCSTTSPCATTYSDSGQVTMSLALKDIGSTVSPNTPTTNNQVTLNRVHIKYVRADGRNVQGVDVPYEFDGAITGTIAGTGIQTFTFEIVRHAAKAEPPLLALITSPSIVTTIAQVTFYGTDAVGNDINVMGQIQIDFGNFGDQ
jgi:hypothetical protein